jgi:hypothetical protein
MGITIPDEGVNHIKMDCIFCGGPLPTPTITSEKQPRPQYYFPVGGSAVFHAPIVTITGEYMGTYAGNYMGERIYTDDPNYKEIIKNASFYDLRY